MLLQTNSYIVPKEKRAEHARLIRRFRQTLARLGCEHFEVYEQVGANWGAGESTGRYVHIMRFRDRKHQLAVQAAERNDAAAQALITEFCELINFPYQQQQGLFAVGFYQSALPVTTPRTNPAAAATDDVITVEDATTTTTTTTADADDVVVDVPHAAEPAADDHVDLGGDDDTSSDETSERQKA